MYSIVFGAKIVNKSPLPTKAVIFPVIGNDCAAQLRICMIIRLSPAADGGACMAVMQNHTGGPGRATVSQGLYNIAVRALVFLIRI